MSSDIIRDLLDRVADRIADKISLPEELRAILGMIEQDIRKDWHGERPYIALTPGDQPRRESLRNRAIIRDHKNGERVAFLSRRYGISARRVRQIING